MSFRTRLLLILAGLALVSNSLVVSLMYVQTRAYLFTEIKNTVLSMVSATAVHIDGDLHDTIRTKDDEGKPTYLAIASQLRAVRDLNRANGLKIKYLYTMRPATPGAKEWVFVVDGEQDPKEHSGVGDVYEPSGNDDTLNLEKPVVGSNFVTDEWGTWLTAAHPIYNRAGKSVATVSADVSADDINRQLNQLLFKGMISCAISLAAAILVAVFLSRQATQPLEVVKAGVARITEGEFDTRVQLKRHDEFGELGDAINRMALGLRQRESLKGALAGYVSAEVTNRILLEGTPGVIGGGRKRITTVFADMRGFTKLSENASPEAVVNLLNRYYQLMIEAVEKHDGYLNKFIGDGIMATFGALHDDPKQEENAVRTALAMRESIKLLASEIGEGIGTGLRIGVGIHTGDAIVGNIGSNQRMEFTAIGDSVNMAASLEASTKDPAHSGIAVSSTTAAAVQGLFPFKDLGPFSLRGRDDSVHVFSL